MRRTITKQQEVARGQIVNDVLDKTTNFEHDTMKDSYPTEGRNLKISALWS